MKSEVVSTSTFLGDSPVAVVVEVHELTAPSGAKNKSVRIRLRMGEYTMCLPRRGLGELIEALQQAKTSADGHYKRLVEKMNQEKNDG